MTTKDIIDRTLVAGAEVASLFVQSPWRLRAANGHFQELVNRSVPIYFTETPTAENGGMDRANIVEAMTVSLADGTMYNTQLTDLAALYIKPVISRIDVLKRKVAPFVKDIVSDIEMGYAQKATMKADIDTMSLPWVLLDGAVYKMTSKHDKFDPVVNKSVAFMGGFMPREESAILELISTGNGRVDDLITDMLAKLPENWLTSKYNQLFVDGGDMPGMVTDVGLIDHAATCFIAYLIVGNFINRNIIDNNIQVGLDEYNSYMSSLLNKLGGMTTLCADRIRAIVNSTELVIYHDKARNVITVYEEMWKDYLDKRGDADALMGALTTGANRIYANDLLNRQEHYISLYHQRYTQELDAQAENFRAEVLKLFASSFNYRFRQLDAAMKALVLSAVPALKSEEIDPTNMTEPQIDAVAAHYTNRARNFPMTDIASEMINVLLSDGLFEEYGFNRLYFRLEQLLGENKGQTPAQAAYTLVLEEVTNAVVDGNLFVEMKQS